MEAEQRELYVYTKDHFAEDLQQIAPDCVAPLIATRRVVLMAMSHYNENYCSPANNPFSPEDFQTVSENIYNEIMKGEL